jgi:hypothetical protein
MTMLRSVLMAAVMGILVIAIAIVLAAIPAGWSILLGLVAAALTLVAAQLSGNIDPNWAPLPEARQAASVLQASTLAARLAEASTDDYRYHTRVQPRLRKLAIGALRQRPGMHDLIDLADPRVRTALGPELHELLVNRKGVLPTPRRLADLLAKLEER